MNRIPLWAVAVLVAAGCTIRLGGPKPVEYRTLGWEVPAGLPAAEAAAVLRSGRAELALLSAEADDAWFEELAAAAGRTVSGPVAVGPTRLAFLGAEPLGDTTVAVPVEGGPALVLHDALYRVDRSRYVNLLAARLDPGAEVLPSVRALLGYMAGDVMVASAVVLAVHVPSAAAGDSVSMLLRPHLTDALVCQAGPRARDAGANAGAAAAPPGNVRLFFGPEAKAYCAGSETLPQPNGPVLMRMVVER